MKFTIANMGKKRKRRGRVVSRTGEVVRAK